MRNQVGHIEKERLFASVLVEKLKRLKFRQELHLNGGSNYSTTVLANFQFGLSIIRETDGSPDFNITSRRLECRANEEISLDLMESPLDLEGFVEQFNEWRANCDA